MQVQLLHVSPLSIVISAIRKCYESEGRSDSFTALDGDFIYEEGKFVLGSKDEELLRRVITSEHTSTLEHVGFTFDIDGISRGCLQELARHRIASLSVKSTRYTLGRVKNSSNLWNSEESNKYLVLTGNREIDENAISALVRLQIQARKGVPNDILKYCLPEAFKTSLIWTINARSLRNFLELRLDGRAHWEIRKLAELVKQEVPESHQILLS